LHCAIARVTGHLVLSRPSVLYVRRYTSTAEAEATAEATAEAAEAAAGGDEARTLFTARAGSSSSLLSTRLITSPILGTFLSAPFTARLDKTALGINSNSRHSNRRKSTDSSRSIDSPVQSRSKTGCLFTARLLWVGLGEVAFTLPSYRVQYSLTCSLAFIKLQILHTRRPHSSNTASSAVRLLDYLILAFYILSSHESGTERPG